MDPKKASSVAGQAGTTDIRDYSTREPVNAQVQKKHIVLYAEKDKWKPYQVAIPHLQKRPS
jgi:hypothetical protein